MCRKMHDSRNNRNYNGDKTGRTEEGRENMFPGENKFSPLGETVRENMFPWQNMVSPRGQTVPARVKEKEARGE